MEIPALKETAARVEPASGSPTPATTVTCARPRCAMARVDAPLPPATATTARSALGTYVCRCWAASTRSGRPPVMTETPARATITAKMGSAWGPRWQTAPSQPAVTGCASQRRAARAARVTAARRGWAFVRAPVIRRARRAAPRTSPACPRWMGRSTSRPLRPLMGDVAYRAMRKGPARRGCVSRSRAWRRRGFA